jgi:hypothetical protein
MRFIENATAHAESPSREVALIRNSPAFCILTGGCKKGGTPSFISPKSEAAEKRFTLIALVTAPAFLASASVFQQPAKRNGHDAIPDSNYIIARGCACEARIRHVACGKRGFIQTEEER